MDRAEIEQHIRRLVLPEPVQSVFHRIQAEGGHVWVVGGVIRDWVWSPKTFEPNLRDWDLTTDLPSTHLQRLKVATHPGEQYGTFLIAPGVEVTHLRREGPYGDQRHPDQVRAIGAIQEDLGRRDFTVNAVAYDGDAITAVEDAVSDLSHRTLRAVGNPWRRFEEDPLRILRLWRFAARCRATVEGSTGTASRELVFLLDRVSRERRLQELLRFLEGPLDCWPLWGEADLDGALDWPKRRHGSEIAPVTVPHNPCTRLAAFALFRTRSWDWLSGWAEVWPLPRRWRRALGAVSNTPPQVDDWILKARHPESRDAWIFADLARSFGVPPDDVGPIRLAIGAETLKSHWGLEGPELGELLRMLEDRVAVLPDDNRPERLLSLATRWVEARRRGQV